MADDRGGRDGSPEEKTPRRSDSNPPPEADGGAARRQDYMARLQQRRSRPPGGLTLGKATAAAPMASGTDLESSLNDLFGPSSSGGGQNSKTSTPRNRSPERTSTPKPGSNPQTPSRRPPVALRSSSRASTPGSARPASDLLMGHTSIGHLVKSYQKVTAERDALRHQYNKLQDALEVAKEERDRLEEEREQEEKAHADKVHDLELQISRARGLRRTSRESLRSPTSATSMAAQTFLSPNLSPIEEPQEMTPLELQASLNDAKAEAKRQKARADQAEDDKRRLARDLQAAKRRHQQAQDLANDTEQRFQESLRAQGGVAWNDDFVSDVADTITTATPSAEPEQWDPAEDDAAQAGSQPTFRESTGDDTSSSLDILLSSTSSRPRAPTSTPATSIRTVRTPLRIRREPDADATPESSPSKTADTKVATPGSHPPASRSASVASTPSKQQSRPREDMVPLADYLVLYDEYKLLKEMQDKLLNRLPAEDALASAASQCVGVLAREEDDIDELMDPTIWQRYTTTREYDALRDADADEAHPVARQQKEMWQKDAEEAARKEADALARALEVEEAASDEESDQNEVPVQPEVKEEPKTPMKPKATQTPAEPKAQVITPVSHKVVNDPVVSALAEAVCQGHEMRRKEVAEHERLETMKLENSIHAGRLQGHARTLKNLEEKVAEKSRHVETLKETLDSKEKDLRDVHVRRQHFERLADSTQKAVAGRAPVVSRLHATEALIENLRKEFDEQKAAEKKEIEVPEALEEQEKLKVELLKEHDEIDQEVKKFLDFVYSTLEVPSFRVRVHLTQFDEDEDMENVASSLRQGFDDWVQHQLEEVNETRLRIEPAQRELEASIAEMREQRRRTYDAIGEYHQSSGLPAEIHRELRSAEHLQGQITELQRQETLQVEETEEFIAEKRDRVVEICEKIGYTREEITKKEKELYNPDSNLSRSARKKVEKSLENLRNTVEQAESERTDALYALLSHRRIQREHMQRLSEAGSAHQQQLQNQLNVFRVRSEEALDQEIAGYPGQVAEHNASIDAIQEEENRLASDDNETNQQHQTQTEALGRRFVEMQRAEECLNESQRNLDEIDEMIQSNELDEGEEVRKQRAEAVDELESFRKWFDESSTHFHELEQVVGRIRAERDEALFHHKEQIKLCLRSEEALTQKNMLIDALTRQVAELSSQAPSTPEQEPTVEPMSPTRRPDVTETPVRIRNVPENLRQLVGLKEDNQYLSQRLQYIEPALDAARYGFDPSMTEELIQTRQALQSQLELNQEHEENIRGYQQRDDQFWLDLKLKDERIDRDAIEKEELSAELDWHKQLQEEQEEVEDQREQRDALVQCRFEFLRRLQEDQIRAFKRIFNLLDSRGRLATDPQENEQRWIRDCRDLRGLVDESITAFNDQLQELHDILIGRPAQEEEEDDDDEEEEVEGARPEGSPQHRLDSSLLENIPSSPMVDRSPEGMDFEDSSEGMDVERASPPRASLTQTSPAHGVSVSEEAQLLTTLEQLRLFHKEVLETEQLSDDARNRYRTGRAQGNPPSPGQSQKHHEKVEKYKFAVRTIENKIRMRKDQLNLSKDPVALEKFTRFLVEDDAEWYNTRIARNEERIRNLDNHTREMEQSLASQLHANSQQDKSNKKFQRMLENNRDEATRARNALADRVSEASEAIHAINDNLMEWTTPQDSEAVRSRQHDVQERLTEIARKLDEDIAPSEGSSAASQQPGNDCPKRLKEAQKKIRWLQQENKRIEAENDRALAAANRLRDFLESETKRADNLNNAMTKYGSDRKTWLETERKLKIEKQEAQKEVKKLREKLEQTDNTPMDVDEANEYEELKKYKEEHLKKRCELVLMKSQSQVAHLNRQIDRLKKDEAECPAKLKAAEEARDKAQIDLRKANDALKDAKTKLTSLEDENISLKSKNLELTRTNEAQVERLEIQGNTIVQNTSKVMALESEVASLKFTRAGPGAQENEDQRRQQEEIRAILDELNEKKSKVALLEHQVSGLQTANSDLSRKLEATRESSSNICPRCQKRDQDEARLNESLRKARANLVEAENRCKTAELQTEEARTVIAQKDRDLKLLQQQLASEKQNYDMLWEQVEVQLNHRNGDVVMAGITPEEAHAMNRPPPRPENPVTPAYGAHLRHVREKPPRSPAAKISKSQRSQRRGKLVAGAKYRDLVLADVAKRQSLASILATPEEPAPTTEAPMSVEEVSNLNRQYVSFMRAVASIQEYVTMACGEDTIRMLASGDHSTTMGHIGVLRTLLNMAPKEPVNNFEDLYSMAKSVWDAMVVADLWSLTVKFARGLESQINGNAALLSEQQSRLSDQETQLSQYQSQLSEKEANLKAQEKKHSEEVEKNRKAHANAVKKFEDTLSKAKEKIGDLTAENTSLQRFKNAKTRDEVVKAHEKTISDLEDKIKRKEAAALQTEEKLRRELQAADEETTKQKTHFEEELKGLKQESNEKIAELKKEIDDSKESLKKAQGSFAQDITTATKDLEDDLVKVREELVKSREGHMKTINGALQCHKQNIMLVDINVDQRNEIKSLTSRLKRVEMGATDELGSYAQTNEKLQQELKKLKASEKAALKKASETNKAYLSLSGELSVLKCKLRNLKDVEKGRRKREQGDLLSMLHADMNSLKDKMLDITRGHQAMSQTCREEIAGFRGLLRAYADMVDFLRSCLALQNTTGGSEAELATLPRAELEDLTVQRDELLKMVEVLKVRADADQGEEGTREKDVQEERHTTSAIERELQQYKDKFKQISSEKMKLEEQNKNQESELIRLRMDLEEKGESNKAMGDMLKRVLGSETATTHSNRGSSDDRSDGNSDDNNDQDGHGNVGNGEAILHDSSGSNRTRHSDEALQQQISQWKADTDRGRLLLAADDSITAQLNAEMWSREVQELKRQIKKLESQIAKWDTTAEEELRNLKEEKANLQRELKSQEDAGIFLGRKWGHSREEKRQLEDQQKDALAVVGSIRWPKTKEPFMFKRLDDAVKTLVHHLVEGGILEYASSTTKAENLEGKSADLSTKPESQNDGVQSLLAEQTQLHGPNEEEVMRKAIKDSLEFAEKAEETAKAVKEAQKNEQVGGAGSRKLVSQLEEERRQLEVTLKSGEEQLKKTEKILAELKADFDSKLVELKDKAEMEENKRAALEKEVESLSAKIKDDEKLYHQRETEVLTLRQSLTESEEELNIQKALLKAKKHRILRLRKELLKLGHADPTVEPEDGPLTPATPITRPNRGRGGVGGTPGNPAGGNSGDPGGDPPRRGGGIRGDGGGNNDNDNRLAQHHFDAVRAKCKGQHDGWDLFIATGMVLWETLGFNLDSFKRLVEFLLLLLCTPVFCLLWLRDLIFYLDNILTGSPRVRQFPVFFRLRPRITKERGYLLVTNAIMAFLLYHAFKTWAVSSGMLRLMLEANGSSRAYYRDVTTYGVPSLYGVPGIDDRFWQEWGTVGEMPLFCREMWMMLQSVWWSPVWKYFGHRVGGGVRVFQLEE